MNPLKDISILDLFFLLRQVDESKVLDDPFLVARLALKRGADWPSRTKALGVQYREAVERMLKESADVARALTGLAALNEDTQAWRRLMELVARDENNAARRDQLLRAVGWGLGTPRYSKDFKDFFVKMAASMVTNEAALAALGASARSIAWPKEALASEELASLDVARERAEEQQARGELRAAYGLALDALDAVFRGVEILRADARFEKDAERLAAANALQSKLDQAVAQARVESRTQAEKGDVPAEVLEPPVPVVTETPAVTG